MPLTQAEIDEADDLLVSLTFGSDAEKSRARAALESWAGDIPERRQYLSDHHAVDRVVDALSDDLGRLYKRHIGPAAVPPRPRHEPPVALPLPSGRRTGVRVAAYGAAVVLLGAVSTLWVVNPILTSQHVQTTVGEHVEVALDDGSHVTLNTDTELTFVNRLRSRDATIQRGEALFSVAHSLVRSFDVSAGTANVRDIGTRFTVRKMADGVDVAVLEGQVELTALAGAAPVSLLAGQAARADRVGNVELQDQQQFDAMVSWKDNRLQFNGTPLRDVVREVQRYRKQPIVLADARVGDYRVTGGFSSADPDLLLKTLSSVVPVTVEFQRAGTAVIAARR
ncbi:TPA: FecR domain-containing protein [Burkholderia multivorans]|uniref:FecR family protein n=1 Tax=Burkholderia multivorans TaxID=87883 RepID=UPI000CFF7905|nr:FecR domain-containing protein [Burkholderia multivorans]MBU9305461.1 FecR domain-containing protein [Burkholderia multivorans]MBU9405696.1 FecR domain-containing protein [Burkholderia multivorans]MBU9510280.1 FecR domain-containing protein [Burkholderia multivorans]MCA8458928.1 FecR domain-containing protein [Burkholderia multivorans]MDN8018083.1 FecR domain-containing protein [Burkholderia multivorans]